MSTMPVAVLTAVLSFAPALAMADQSIAGQWRADEGHKVIIVMDVLVDGHWASETVRDDKAVAELAGTYQQTPRNATSGTIVWTPVKSKVTQEHGAAQVETDDYTLEDGGQKLLGDQKLATSGGCRKRAECNWLCSPGARASSRAAPA